MTEQMATPGNDTDKSQIESLPADDLIDVSELDESDFQYDFQKKVEFAPWHHPVKQLVRDYQWATLTKKLLQDHSREGQTSLRYFTLPGNDFFDVRVIGDVCQEFGLKVQYFGFNSAPGNQPKLNEKMPWSDTEAALRQAGLISDSARIYPDRLEDIAVSDSYAAQLLKQQDAFDVVNIDACDHLAYRPENRRNTTFDALNQILEHQLTARRPWLLFLTTRADPALLGQPWEIFNEAIQENIAKRDTGFREELAKCLEASAHLLPTAMIRALNEVGSKFLQLYCLGIGKHLLRYYHAQRNLPAKVELASIYGYRVHHAEPDMLAAAFRITPLARIMHQRPDAAAVAQ